MVEREDAPTSPVAAGTRALGAQPAFSAGDLVAARYRIHRFIAQGGMGEVYEAEDLELGERVALKTVRSEIARDHRAIARFKREILLARKVTHPNVSRIFDLGRHQARSPEREVTFLTMELLAGESLAERIHRSGRIGTTEALPIVEQMTAALAAAHGAGIVHRDFKSANVILVPLAEGGEGPRAVVTDFGLARAGSAAPSADTATTDTGLVMGTAAYMAPEQVEGGEIGPAADIYALGIVMYEMVTGSPPFKGDTPLSTAVKRLKMAPPSPRITVPDLDPRWEATILRCLEKDPAARFEAAEDVGRALRGEPVGRRRTGRSRTRDVWGAVAALVALAILYPALPTWKARPTAEPTGPGSPPGPSRTRRTVAVLGFKNLAGRPEAAWLSTALSEMLVTELAAGEKLRTIPGENVARMRIDLALAEADSLAKDTLSRIRTNLGADLVVLGSYVALGKGSGGGLRLDLRLQDTVAGETIVSVAERGTEADLFELVSRTGERVRERLGVGGLTAAQAGAVKAALPSSPEAARLYSEGLARLRLFDASGARDRLEQALALGPGHPQAHAALAEAWLALGYDDRARAEARKALDLAGGLTREERLSVEGRYRETTREWAKAIDVYRALFGFFPDNLEYGLRLAAAQRFAGDTTGALATLRALRTLPPPDGEDPRIDVEEAAADYAVSDFHGQQAAAARAIRTAERRGARLVVAQASVREAWALLRLGESKKARQACERARDLYAAAGDRAGVATALGALASVHFAEGDLDESRRIYGDCLKIHRETGNRMGMAFALTEQGNVIASSGDLAGAERAHAQSLSIRRELGYKLGIAMVLDNLGEVLYRRADLRSAQARYEEALQVCREIGDKDVSADVLRGIGDILLARGDVAGARKRYEESLALYKEVGSKQFSADPLFGMGEVLLAEGDLSGARRKHEEALALRDSLGQTGAAAWSRLALARLSLEEGRSPQAEAAAREALEAFRRQRAPDAQALALAVLTRARLVEGRLAEARETLDQASALAARSQSPFARLAVAVASARVEAAAGRPAVAVKALASTVAEATRHGLVGLELEARLALGEIERNGPAPAAGRSRLEALEAAARAKGYGLVARRAAEARR